MTVQHISKTRIVYCYQAPPDLQQEDRLIEDMEEVEVILRGRGYFEIEGNTVDAGPGDIIWYYPGQTAVITSHETDPYQCMVFRFEIASPPLLRVPNRTHWYDLAECEQFCREAEAYFHSNQPVE